MSRWISMLAIVVTAFGLGCGNRDQANDDAAIARSRDVASKPKTDAGLVKAMEPKPRPKREKPTFGAGIRGLRLKRSIVVRAQPSLDAEKLGTVAAHTVVDWNDAVVAPGCESRWIAIVPKGWVCEGYLEPVKSLPAGVELPKLQPAERVPGSYGKVIGEEAVVVTIKDGAIISESPILSASTVRKRGSVVVDDVPYWKIDGKQYIATTSLRVHKPSNFQGSRLQGTVAIELPMAFAYSSKRPGDWVVVRDDNDKQVRRLAPRSVVSIEPAKHNASGAVTLYKIGDGEFILAKDLRIVEMQKPPPTTRPYERWFDIDLSTQILVAYEGDLPVYATLISSGTRKNPTETGIFRIWIKFSETTMSGRMGESDAYSVATVPWTQFYENDFALHTSYWHNFFGQQRSHGCINLSPHDARFVYFWSDPQVPRGWSMANSSANAPGSMVRVRSKADPDPEFKGRGKKVYEARLAAATSAER